MGKRNCRKTDKEREIHDRAVSIRKMTDVQLCEYIEELCSAAESKARGENSPADTIKTFIAYLEGKKGLGNRIGGGTIQRLKDEMSNAVNEGVFKCEG